jgi:hypothetical protein
MNESRGPDHLMGAIRRAAETLTSCERTIHESHTVLAAAHLQLERSRELHRQLEILDHLYPQDVLTPGHMMTDTSGEE